VIMYLDDMLVMAQMREELEGHLRQITTLMEALGFVVNLGEVTVDAYPDDSLFRFPD